MAPADRQRPRVGTGYTPGFRDESSVERVGVEVHQGQLKARERIRGTGRGAGPPTCTGDLVRRADWSARRVDLRFTTLLCVE